MSRLLPIGMLVLLAIGAWFAIDFLRTKPDEPTAEAEIDSPQEPASPPIDEVDSASDADATRIAVQPEEERVAADPDATWVVTGQTLRGWQDPYPDVPVQLDAFAGEEAVGEPIATAALRSDETGKFAWPLPPPEQTITVRVTSTLEKHRSNTPTATVAAGGPPPDLELRLYPLDRAIEGTVRDAAGTPLANIEVRSVEDTTLTAEDGTYQLVATSVRSEVMVYATGEGYAQKRATAQIAEAGTPTVVDFTLARSFQVRGRVMDEAGLPVEGAVVRTFFTNQNEAVTDSAGHFHLDHLDPLRDSHHVFARKDGYVEASTRVSPTAAILELPDLVLTRGVHVEGMVLGPAGEPLAGATLYIGFSPSAYNRLDATSDENGVFVFPHVEPGSQTMVTNHPKFSADNRTLELSADRPVVTGIVVQLEAGHFIGGVVRSEQGESLTGVSLSARHRGEYLSMRTRTDDEGRFRMDGLPGEDVGLEFYGRGVVRKQVKIEQLDHDQLEVTLQRSGQLAGRVIDGVTGEPIQEFLIRFVRMQSGTSIGSYGATWAREGHRFTGTDGYWDSGDETLVPGGSTGIEARATGYAPGQLDGVVVSHEPDPDEWVLRLYPGATVRGLVLDAHGAEVAGARIRAMPAESDVRYFSDEPHDANTTTTADDGTFELPAVAPGSVVILVRPDGRPQQVDGPFEVPRSGFIDRTIRLSGGGGIVGTLVDSSNVPQAGAEITVFAHEVPGVDSYHTSTRTDATGGFQFEGLPAGLYQLSHAVQEGDINFHAITVFARVADLEQIRVRLRPQGHLAIHGSLHRSDGEDPPAAIAVSAFPTHNPDTPRELEPPHLGTLARDGRFTLPGLVPGEYTLRAFDYSSARILIGHATVTLTDADGEVEMELQVQSGR